MSIEEIIGFRVSDGMLFPLIPKARGATARRAMYVSEDIWALLSTTHEDEELEERLGILQADLELFADGQPIDPKYLFLLSPIRDAVWEIRSVRPEPSIRVMCLFAKKDVLIATNIALRENLGGWDSKAWKEAKRLARARWNVLFHTYICQ
ncbi:hypothetical protein MTX26_16770 [Bradyrhizobium sp. ISRA443]|uniref:hypothetical protein n=1 Tax=unclassified Bradyrhizobium TaxID=2631580 RepID=UPI00247A4E7D|nr:MULTISPECIES: hypothetical protein [unclassified Bradyrhizobium]WGR91965.1 hypothetical protein MTX20_27360 [Bradyrhizobium sp. ISRA435]WGS02372.1 hypothetical protein MTX23_16780 [Bradyrhizobium sp. ISRA436]WGS09257.1 hypothetical protein MTX18_16770 [Bradyrhizobium sp. ISRA437]WGS16146.1 hypothetical protein MTX26_16770 [Bradyrhizobium sp. ISRA443]